MFKTFMLSDLFEMYEEYEKFEKTGVVNENSIIRGIAKKYCGSYRVDHLQLIFFELAKEIVKRYKAELKI